MPEETVDQPDEIDTVDPEPGPETTVVETGCVHGLCVHSFKQTVIRECLPTGTAVYETRTSLCEP